MTLKTLVTGFVTGTAGAAMVVAAAAGVTSIASGAVPAAPAVQPVVFGSPLPQTPGVPLPQAPGVPATDGDLYATLNVLAESLSGDDATLILIVADELADLMDAAGDPE